MDFYLTEEEKERARERLNAKPQPYTGTNVTIFFPSEEKLNPVDYCGIPPREGEIMCFRNYSRLNNVPEMDFNNRRKWVVETVWNCLEVIGNSKEKFLYDNQHRVEVHVRRME